MLSKSDKEQLRSVIFRHLDGIATAATTTALNKKGLLAYLLEHKKVELSELTKKFNANEGYLNVALRLLASQGWLIQHLDNTTNAVSFQVNELSKKAFDLAPLYTDPVNLLSYAVKFPEERIGSDAFSALERIFIQYKNNFGINTILNNSIEHQILMHIEGVIVAPIIVMLGVSGLFHKYFMEASFRAQEFHSNPESFKKILDFFTHLGWFIKKNDTYRFTDEGLFFAKRASAYGVTVSYLPTFVHLDELIFGNPLVLKTSSSNETEKHVHREMNVWGSGGAHSTYFKVIDEIIINVFNKPIAEQPKGILDMGCGNGAFIQHIFDVIEYQTLRGKMLDEYPLLLVGADYNQAALKVTRANLIKADIWAKVIWGDIGRPDILAKDLKEDYNIDLKDLLNVRTFLDHNRIWEAPKKVTNRTSKSSGAYAYQGQRLNNNDVEDSLLEHFKKWKPYVEKFGLLIIELHTINPKLTANNLGKTAATAYDATHGYSDQYILEVDVFIEIAKEAGLNLDRNYFTKFPNNDLATVSINLLKG
jgi:SAM-dependent methyltransferase